MNKKLLLKVTGISERLVETISIEDNILNTHYDCGKGKPTCLGYEINIHQLMEEMKEWAWKQGYSLANGKAFAEGKGKEPYFCTYTTWKGLSEVCDECGLEEEPFMRGKTAFEAVTKVCEWIENEQKV